ncbi:uncharacterized protein PHALS_15142 [Plasmopara halstedii]|uniref:Uncharacterized protein n=1 Tax=Plasmopara halstedii TaxID=4781 RepID=A0A0P1B0Q6_PLAHL|nr:uncharacterized protein PHALS_15142 [Plasmopara halstedii]CEG48263.1 hypothetical protein PHALS_15142 [Plasmopara halstedii]|eukprot:XP_024584632.1 hypothetical protein PHALS_15142 [Plasmopara halstedii]
MCKKLSRLSLPLWAGLEKFHKVLISKFESQFNFPVDTAILAHRGVNRKKERVRRAISTCFRGCVKHIRSTLSKTDDKRKFYLHVKQVTRVRCVYNLRSFTVGTAR